MFWPENDGLFIGPFDFDAVSFDGRIIFQGVMDDPPIKGIERLEFDDVPPAADFLRGIPRFFDESLAGLSAVTADVDGDFWSILVEAKEQPIGDVLQFAEGLTLPSDQAPCVVRFNIQKQTTFQVVFFDGDVETESLQELLENGFGLGGHNNFVRINGLGLFLFERNGPGRGRGWDRRWADISGAGEFHLRNC